MRHGLKSVQFVQVFGRVIGESLLVVRKLENVPTGPNNRPKMQVLITECGEM